MILFYFPKTNRENVRVLSFGVFVLFMYPGAFVELHTDQLDIITPFRRLRIFSAGVWHNFILVLVSYLLSISLPFWLSPFYTTGGGVLITHISPVGIFFFFFNKHSFSSTSTSILRDLLHSRDIIVSL